MSDLKIYSDLIFQKFNSLQEFEIRMPLLKLEKKPLLSEGKRIKAGVPKVL